MLNEKQKQASEKLEGSLLIVAGAGSGKTKTLTHRIANLLKSGVKPWEIAAVTFTNKAGQEMRQRVEQLLGLSSKGQEVENENPSPQSSAISPPFIGTFHSFCLRILRAEIDKLGFKNDFTIYDTTDQVNAIKLVLEKLGFEVKKENPKSRLSRISNYKNVYQSADHVLAYYGESDRKTANIYKEYQNLLKENNALDFDDILFFTVELLEKFPEVKEKYSNRYKHICVDEYQDTNFIQYKLIKLLGEKNGNVCVIGDSDQSIYSFRGADIRNILEFEQDFAPCEVIKLEQNYRSTQTILKAADQVISNNVGRQKKTMWSNIGEGEKITVAKLNGERQEAEYIAEEIGERMRIDVVNDCMRVSVVNDCMRVSVVNDCNRSLQGNTNLSDFAVLYRTNAQSRAIEEALVKNGISYKIIGGLKFYDRKEVKDILAYLRLIYSPSDSVSLLRIINTPARKIGKTSIVKMQAYAWQRMLGLGEMVRHIDTVEGLSSGAKKAIQAFSEMIEELRKKQKEIPLSEFIDLVISSTGYLAMLEKEDSIESKGRLENLEELKSVAMKFDNLGEEALGKFLEEVALVADTDSIDDGNQVLLMTLHSAKGLEFKNVFMVGLEEGIFPSSQSFEDEFAIEEERRLMYVGITRAKEKLYLTHTKTRLLYGEFKNNPPSRFLGEISEELTEQVDKTYQESTYRSGYGNGNYFRSNGNWY